LRPAFRIATLWEQISADGNQGAKNGMAQPSVTTVTIDGLKFNALTANVSLATSSDMSGMPGMGSLSAGVQVVVDIHDNVNMPFSTLKHIYDLASVVTRDKVKDIKIEYWQDEKQADALCVYTFKGWISHWSTGSGNGANHTLSLTLQPAMDQKNFADMQLSN
jgi:hypothetical protein